MTNKEIYKKTLTFSVRRLLFDVLTIVLVAAITAAGYLIAENAMDKGLIGLLIGLIVGIIVAVIISRFISYALKAGQIAMMTRAVTEGELPDNVYAEGKRMVKERFATVAAYFAATKIIKGIFDQLGRVITSVGDAIGGDTGSTIGSVISSAIQTVVGYLCDCCLGWVFFRKAQSAVRATCEGAVLFFKHGKTLAKNAGRIFGMGIASLLVIGGAFTGIFYLIFSSLGTTFNTLASEIAEAAARAETELPSALTDPTTLMIICAAVIGIVIWLMIHSAFIRPFILAGVIKNYMESGMNDIPTEESFSMLDGKSKKFAKLRAELD
ncbi:MAG: hypothetical protein IKN38_07380 [Clostridia bacterium]|nr:hypothetical protein [Clostridia bacterium]